MFCDNENCSKKRFAETFEFVNPRGKMTKRLEEEIVVEWVWTVKGESIVTWGRPSRFNNESSILKLEFKTVAVNSIDNVSDKYKEF